MNAQNAKTRADNTSGYRGVSWSKSRGKLAVQINVNKRRKSLGFFSDINQAAEVARQSMVEFYPGYVF
jgi:hypothetical protein